MTCTNSHYSGKDNFAVDREAAQWVQEALPWLPDAIRGCRHFLGSSVHALAAEYGIRQFLDVGPGLPTVGNTHEVAQQVAPGSLQEADDPYGIVGRLMSVVPPGSFLVMVHGASDLLVEVTEGTRRYNEVSSEPLAFRTREQVTRFFDGLEILDTGSGDGRVGESAAQLSYFGIGRKP
jgi:hypothetical protein